MAETPSEVREKNEKIPKPGGKLEKYKWWLVGGLAVIAIAVFYFTRNQSGASANTASATPSTVDPATGVPYATEFGAGGQMGFGYGTTGATGPAGPAGAAGARGKAGKTGAAGKPGKRGGRGIRGKPGKTGHFPTPHRGHRGALGVYTPQGQALESARARAIHNARIIPAKAR